LNTKNSIDEKFPLFVVAGMPRGGTTFLYHNLNKHPSIYLPYRKEINYFTVHHSLGVKWYHSLYKERQPQQVAGDISPPCFLDPLSAERIRDYNPETKVVLIIRDPVDWILSFYAQFQSFNFNMVAFTEFIEGYDYRIGDKTLRLECKNNKIVDSINAFRKVFKSNILLYDFTFFSQNTLTVLQLIEKFIGVPPYFKEGNYDNVKINASRRKNIKILSYFLSREWIASGLRYLVPRSVTLYFRNRYDFLGASIMRKNNDDNKHSEQDIRIADKELKRQCEYIKKMFSSCPVQLGTGEPFI
jgi:Sulfotransferase domain